MVRPPIVVDARSEVLVFRRVEDVTACLEAVDLENGEYGAAYDSEGRLLELGIKLAKRRALFGLIPVTVEAVDVRAAEKEPTHGWELADLLRRHLSRLQPNLHLVPSLEGLVAVAVDRFGYKD